MLLEVRRELIPIPIGMASPWEQYAYSQLVWKHDGVAQVFPLAVPDDYALGLLTPYLDGAKVSLQIFEAALHTVGCSRRDIEAAIGLCRD